MRTLFAHIRQALMGSQFQKAIAAGMTAVLLLMTPINLPLMGATVDAGVQSRLDDLESKGESGRPRTTGQFREDKAALEGKPGKVIQRMGSDAASAFEDANETVGQTIKDLTTGADTQLPKDD